MTPIRSFPLPTFLSPRTFAEKTNIILMKKYSLFFALCLPILFVANTKAQTVYGETIEVLEGRLKADTTLYDRIGARLLAGDPTLTNRDLAAVYYGNALRPGYNPLQEERILDAMNTLARREKYTEALSLCDNFLKKNPGSLPAWLERGYTSWLMEDSIQTVETYQKYYQLLDVPLKSGTGESFDQAIVVASLRDVELVVDKLGFVAKDQSLVNRDGQRFHIVKCTKDGDKTVNPTYYFNVELPLGRGMQQSLNKKG
jgi:tetratricopeptide (TPR) repeat protein